MSRKRCVNEKIFDGWMKIFRQKGQNEAPTYVLLIVPLVVLTQIQPDNHACLYPPSHPYTP